MSEEGDNGDESEQHIRVGPAEEEDPSLRESDPSGRFQRYDEQIAEGRFKTVYRGYDIKNGIDVAWCKLRGDSGENLNTIYSEMCKGLSLDHPNIIRCYRCWIDSTEQCINLITELFTSGTLREYRETYSNVELNVHRKHLRQILSGLVYLHSMKPAVVHADIRLDKIYVNGFNGEVKLGDLGLSTLLTQRYHPSEPPEFDSPLSDIFAVGICGYELITGIKLDRLNLVKSVMEIQNLEKVKDPDARDFITKCFSMTEGLTAQVLLEHPFLKSKTAKIKLQNGGDWKESRFDAECNKGVGTRLRGEDRNFEFRGYRSEDEDENVHIRLVMNEAESEHVTTLDFDYNLDEDTPESVGGDIADYFALSITDRELCKAALREWLSVMSSATKTSSNTEQSSSLTDVKKTTTKFQE
eukprot:g6941.t1